MWTKSLIRQIETLDSICSKLLIDEVIQSIERMGKQIEDFHGIYGDELKVNSERIAKFSL